MLTSFIQLTSSVAPQAIAKLLAVGFLGLAVVMVAIHHNDRRASVLLGMNTPGARLRHQVSLLLLHTRLKTSFSSNQLAAHEKMKGLIQRHQHRMVYHFVLEILKTKVHAFPLGCTSCPSSFPFGIKLAQGLPYFCDTLPTMIVMMLQYEGSLLAPVI